MSRSGTYKLINGQMVKISDKIPSLNGVFDVHFNEAYYSQSLGQVVHNKQEKQELMRRRGLIETQPGERIATRPKPTPEQRKRAIEESLNRHLTDRGVEGIKLKDLHRQRGEKPWELRTQQELRATAGLAIPAPAQTVILP